MITELKITGFRGFEDFSLHDLGRINLLVGSNNGGKTSVLEAIQFLVAQGNLRYLSDTMMRRGGYMWPDSQIKELSGPEIDVCRLFYGYNMEPDSQFTISGKRGSFNDTVRAAILESEYDNSPEQIEDYELASPYILKLTWHNSESVEEKLRLSRQGGLSYDRLMSRYPKKLSGQADKAFLIPTDFLSVDEIILLFEDIVLTSEEQLVIDSIKIIEPTVERIASVGRGKRIFVNASETRGGIVIKCKGIKQRIPIGSMGDGLWRMLGVTLALVKAEGGILLIDEIDTGLHFTVMENMWKLITQTAKRLDVQVFATTHNSDCWTSLAAILCDEDAIDVTIQRIEKDKKQSVAFTYDEIVIAAEREIEVR